MIEENVIKKSLQNLYQLINQYYEKLKIKNKETGITQEMLDYDASIYRNIEYKTKKKVLEDYCSKLQMIEKFRNVWREKEM